MITPLEFSSNESACIERRIDDKSPVVHTDAGNFDFVYEIERCAAWIKSHAFHKVCLQFPDRLLLDSTEVAQRLQSLVGQTVYVMADTAYESCCVDYVGAVHVEADAVIHYGPVCFSKSAEKIPCLWIYEKLPLDCHAFREACTKKFSEWPSNIVVIVDTPYITHIDALRNVHPQLNLYPVDSDNLPLCSKDVIFISNNTRKTSNLQLVYQVGTLYMYNPQLDSNVLSDYQQNMKVLKRRYFLIEKIKDSKSIGIVIGTLAVRNYLHVIERMKKLICACGKNYYIISVGKPTVSKLANFPELDVYLLIACAMNEIYDSTEFYKPIVAPYDVEVALNPRSGELRFSYDFNSYLPNKDLTDEDLSVIQNSELNDISLITGRVRWSSDGPQAQRADTTAVAVRAEGTVAVSSSFGAGFLTGRSWKGLEQNLGEMGPEKAVEGRRGVAYGYVNEKEKN